MEPIRFKQASLRIAALHKTSSLNACPASYNLPEFERQTDMRPKNAQVRSYKHAYKDIIHPIGAGACLPTHKSQAEP